jgi:hypothetical protein
MTVLAGDKEAFHLAVAGLLRGDFTASDPLFEPDGPECAIVAWHQRGWFADEPAALEEALACACFNGRVGAARYLLEQGIDPARGDRTGLSAVHWAAERGQLAVVRLLIEHHAPLELRNSYGGTVLGCTVWSAQQGRRADHLAIIAALLAAGASLDTTGYPTGDADIDALLGGCCG